MRLLKFDGQGEPTLTEFHDAIPPYAILSHTWGPDQDEVDFDDLQRGSFKNKAGYAKIRFCGEQARKDQLEYFWVDTCCINKADFNELHEAITSMFRWYRDAVKCYVYLSDVSRDQDDDYSRRTWKQAFRGSKWFTRGWTLQELIAPASVEFFSREEERLGNKATLEQQIHEVTGLPISLLRGESPVDQFTIEERMQWVRNRNTKKREDKAYCLLGIFGVFMPLIYGEGEENAFLRLQEEIDKLPRSKSLEGMDSWIREECYCPDNLKIVRLSGQELPMDQCYINLAIVRRHRQDAPASSSKIASKSSPFSLLSRLHITERGEQTQVPLSTLFGPCTGPSGGAKRPRRILIRGQAGMGKTTLCKKVVYDFTHNAMWADSFRRLLWIPLRKLKVQVEGSSIQDLFRDVFFLAHIDGASIARRLHERVVDSKNGRTLFVLDGLDEVSEDIPEDGGVFQLLLYLLNQPNVIITTRPDAVLPNRLYSPDLELETVGFYPDQVTAYLKKTFSGSQQAEQIDTFLKDHELIQGLVRVPILLDALCLTWEYGDSFRSVPDTMTAVYGAIEHKLWRKDIVRLNKIVGGRLLGGTTLRLALPSEIRGIVQNEMRLLETLAFTGLHANVINFTPHFLDTMCEHFEEPQSFPLLYRVLHNISFLRTSESAPENHGQSFHFLHLTFQEYFAARYFVRRWRSQSPLECLQPDNRSVEEISPASFLQKHKHQQNYNIMWRFVVGLLQPGEDDTRRFFKTIGEHSHIRHQRLIMQCLSEVSHSNSSNDLVLLRRELEDKTSEWLRLRDNFKFARYLASGMEFPRQMLDSILREGPDQAKISVLNALQSWPRLQPYIINSMGSLLDEKNNGVRSAAVEVLRGQSSLSDEILNQVVARLQDQDRDVRCDALGVLQGQSSLSDEILNQVVAQLQDEYWAVRYTALRVLRDQSSLSDEILNQVVAQLQDEYWEVRYKALHVLQVHSSLLSDEILNQVVARLQDQDRDVRCEALHVLRHQSSLSDEILNQVVARLQDENRAVRCTALYVLQVHSSLLSDEILNQVEARLQDQDSRVRSAAAALFERHRPSGTRLRLADLREDSPPE
ncbi:hypothetical protein A1O3_03880 [Capronia epimyces CBS 606.96]|uniref:NACHT domain-containing protein n=1 Tax=Capronia epimyces CBS 606.96 TaxID=1182542 RepID=W9YCG4_9EURO|nr:uncharacterized protein A1O3_03880 [Capronia epimyces CBS 606.96]EXJ86926.1 hypothetical protein A1O3_03880 [Capronia epimyces CBS 606.96]